MKDYLLKKRKLEFKKTVTRWQNLPKVWKASFEDGQDMRIWFNNIMFLDSNSDFVKEVIHILKSYNVKILTDIEKEKEFMNFIKKNKKIPERCEVYFSDNDDMYAWYLNYQNKNIEYARKIHKLTAEYSNFDLEEIWEDIKQEFLLIIKRLKRIPEIGEAIISNYNFDVRVIYNKIEKENKPTYEQALIHIETYRDKSISMDDRLNELKLKVEELGYLPELKEYTFSDGVDMFVWYTKYKNNFPVIKEHIEPLIKKEHHDKYKLVNIYKILYFKTKRGSSYNINIKEKEKLNLSNIILYEQELEKLNTIKPEKNISKQKEKISFTDIKKGISS